MQGLKCARKEEDSLNGSLAKRQRCVLE
uniref:Uncharacterized protein n=1 Tax=Arundo donax TaxID=35708 RepID=A0A0A9E7Y3_ARUDO